MSIRAIFTTLILCLALALFATACNGSPEGAIAEDTSQPIDLTGTWKTSKDETFDMKATISDNFITVEMTTEDLSALYWKGTFPVPEDASEGDKLSIRSVADTEALQASLLGSQDSVKKFTYSDHAIKFPFTIAGMKAHIVLTKE